MMKSKKILSIILSLVIIMTSVMPLGLTAFAQTGGKTQTDAVNWAKAQVGKALDYDGQYGAQCVDLIAYYYKYLGNTTPGGNAKDYATNALPSGWKRIANYNGFVPSPGDIAVWKQGTSGYGHVGIVISANLSNLTVVDQYGSTDQKTHTTTYKYSWGGFYGVIRPDFATSSTPSSPSLSAPTNVKANVYGKQLNVTWNSVSGANCYDVIVTDPSGKTNYYHSTGTSSVINISRTGKYKLNVQSLWRKDNSTQGQIVGAHSSEVSLNVSIFGPTNVKVNVVDNNFVVSWDAASGANCYDVIYTDSNNNTSWLHTSQTNKTIKISTKPGTYTFDVQSLYRPNGSSSNQAVGAHSQKITYNLSLNAPKNVYVSSDKNKFMAGWDVVAGATIYYAVVKNSSGETVDSVFTTENKFSSSNRSVNYPNGRYSFYVTPYYRPNNSSSTGQHIGKTCNAVTFDLKECGHNFKAKITKQPTCNSTGTRVLTCTECGYTYSETINKKSHDFSNNSPTCKLCGTANPNYVAPTPTPSPAPSPAPIPELTQPQPTTTTTTTAAKTVAKPKSAKFKKVKPAKKAISVEWKKVSGVSGYEIQLATDKKFKKNKKTVTVKKQKTTKTTVKKLKAKKKYYVRIRTYKIVNGKKVYSSWSKVKSVKTK